MSNIKYTDLRSVRASCLEWLGSLDFVRVHCYLRDATYGENGPKYIVSVEGLYTLNFMGKKVDPFLSNERNHVWKAIGDIERLVIDCSLREGLYRKNDHLPWVLRLFWGYSKISVPSLRLSYDYEMSHLLEGVIED